MCIYVNAYAPHLIIQIKSIVVFGLSDDPSLLKVQIMRTATPLMWGLDLLECWPTIRISSFPEHPT